MYNLPNLLVFMDLQLSEMKKESFLLQTYVPPNLRKHIYTRKGFNTVPSSKTCLRYFASQFIREVKLKEF